MAVHSREISYNVARVAAFSILDLEIIRTVGKSCSICAESAWRQSLYLAGSLSIPFSAEFVGIENLIIKDDGEKMLEDFSVRVAREHPMHV